MSKNTLKSIGAVVAGFLAAGVLSAITDAILEKTGIFTPPDEGLFTLWMLIVALLYRSAYTVLGGYLAARLAPSNPQRHAAILGVIGTIAATLSAIAVMPKDLSPDWFPIALAVLAFPSAWLGGTLATKNKM